ncbi:MAG: 16S rRNA (uracil(1498)-N(3))-methyltransferase [Candidatus Azobacteroides sp.]|nr:16S rRNA (uracil(1498)-N(3))-methyltransferase [Candidatus Azobacteroides sp.]
MHIFYTPDILQSNELPQEEAQHCTRVLRLKESDKIRLTDGQGHFFEAEITAISSKHCHVQLLEKIKQDLPWKNQIHIAMAPTKNMDRNEWFAEKVTEIGVNQITFLNCRYSERKEIKSERIEKILIAAIKQSQKATLPELHSMVDLKHFVSQDFAGQKFIAHCYDKEKMLLSHAYKKGENAIILIGPEGDFSEEEVALAIKHGFQPVSLGESRLRTETAALTACQTIHIINSHP